MYCDIFKSILQVNPTNLLWQAGCASSIIRRSKVALRAAKTDWGFLMWAIHRTRPRTSQRSWRKMARTTAGWLRFRARLIGRRLSSPLGVGQA